MASTSPMIKLRRAFRSLGAFAEQAAAAVTQHSYSRGESDKRRQFMLAEHRREMTEIRNQILLGSPCPYCSDMSLSYRAPNSPA